MRMSNVFRRYHRQIAVLTCLPVALTVTTGTAYPIFDDWLSLHKVSGFLLKIHSGRVFGLEAIYPVLNGLSLIGLLVTGLSMTNLFGKKRSTVSLPIEPLEAEKELIQR